MVPRSDVGLLDMDSVEPIDTETALAIEAGVTTPNEMPQVAKASHLIAHRS